MKLKRVESKHAKLAKWFDLAEEALLCLVVATGLILGCCVVREYLQRAPFGIIFWIAVGYLGTSLGKIVCVFMLKMTEVLSTRFWLRKYCLMAFCVFLVACLSWFWVHTGDFAILKKIGLVMFIAFVTVVCGVFLDEGIRMARQKIVGDLVKKGDKWYVHYEFET